jgi:hypothetical protein
MALVAPPADAAERGARRQRAAEGAYTRQTERARTENGRVRRDDVVGPRGRSASRDATAVNDRAACTRTREVEFTDPNGRQATRRDVTQRTENGRTRDSGLTPPGGRTVTRSAEVVRDEAAGTRSRTATRANGSSATRDVTASYDPQTKTVVKDVSVTRQSAAALPAAAP